MIFSRPLRSELFRIGKRSQLSLDGTVKGIVYNNAGGAPAMAPLPSGGPAPLYEKPAPSDYIPHGPEPYVMPASHPFEPPPIPSTPQPTGRSAERQTMFTAPDAMWEVNAAIDEIHQEWQAMRDAAFDIVSDAGPDPTLQAIHEMFHAPRRAADEISYGGPAMSDGLFSNALADAAAPEVIAPIGTGPAPEADAVNAMFYAPTHAPEPLDYQEAAMTPELFAQETGVAPDAAIPIMPAGPAADFFAPPNPMQPADNGSDPFIAGAAPGSGLLEQVVQYEFDNMSADSAAYPGQPMPPGTDPTQMTPELDDLLMQQQMAPYMAPGMPMIPGMPQGPGPM